MKIYLAGASSEIDMCSGYMQTLRDLGHTITFDWAECVRKVGDANPRTDAGMVRKKFARDDIWGVKDATLVWVLVPEKTSIGCWVELGYALALRESRPEMIVIASGDFKKTIFTALCDFQFEAHDVALQWVQTFGKEQQLRFVSG